MAPIVEAIRNALLQAERVLVVTHVAPDGDAIASLTAAGLALQQLSKSFSLVCDDSVPDRFNYLPLSDQVQSRPPAISDYELLIALDCGDADRMGQTYAELSKRQLTIINIDHHATNSHFGHVNLVDKSANATAEILFHLLPKFGVQITPELAQCLLTGIVTDTLSFRTAGVNASTLKAASALIEAGADLFTITTLALNLRPFSTLLIWQKGLNNMKMEDGLLWTRISNQEREASGHDGSSSFGLGNMMADVEGAAMSAVLLEMADGRVSVGFRSRPPYSVAELAQSLGGGGHPLAAGCTLDGPLAAAESLVVARGKESIRLQRVAQSGGEPVGANS